MLSFNEVKKNLQKIETLAKTVESYDDQFLYNFLCKSSLVEVSGYIEEQFEEVIRKIDPTTTEKIIKNNHGFNFEAFKEMLTSVIGLKKFGEIKNQIDNLFRKKIKLNFETNHRGFSNTLGEIKKKRSQIHTTSMTVNIGSVGQSIEYLEKTEIIIQEIKEYCENNL